MQHHDCRVRSRSAGLEQVSDQIRLSVSAPEVNRLGAACGQALRRQRKHAGEERQDQEASAVLVHVISNQLRPRAESDVLSALREPHALDVDQ